MKILNGILAGLVAVAGTFNTLSYGEILDVKSMLGVESLPVSVIEEIAPSESSALESISAAEALSAVVSKAPEETDAQETSGSSASAAVVGVPPEKSVEGKYSVTEIAKISYDLGFGNDSSHLVEPRDDMAYDSAAGIVYYKNNDAIYTYDINTKTSSEFTTYEAIENTLFGESEVAANSLINDNYPNEMSLDGIAINPYTNDLYIYGYSTEGYFVINWPESIVCFVEFYAGDYRYSDWKYFSYIYKLYFCSENEFYWRGCIYLFGEGDATRVTNDISVYTYLFDRNDFYYNCQLDFDKWGREYSRLERIGSVYAPSETELADNLEFIGVHYYDGYLYGLESDNSVYKIDVDKLTKDPYIPVSDIYQTGKLFLGKGECLGLLVTGDGGFVTYDVSNNTLKHIAPLEVTSSD